MISGRNRPRALSLIVDVVDYDDDDDYDNKEGPTGLKLKESVI